MTADRIAWLVLITFLGWVGYSLLFKMGENLAEADRQRAEFTEADVFCAAFARQEAAYADQYTDAELLRICYTHRITTGAP